MSIDYRIDAPCSAEQFIDVLKRSKLAERRPVDDPERIAQMVAGANVTVTAWDGDYLVGVSRALSDFSYCTYLSDLAVDVAYQRQGIGKELIRHRHEAGGLASKLILLAAPAAEGYYPQIGLQAHRSCWVLPGR